MPGILTLVSSKKYPDDLIHVKLREARDKPDRIYVYDQRIWQVRPERYGRARFKVFTGDPTRKPRILQPSERVAGEDRSLVVRVPVEFRHAFEQDLLKALAGHRGRLDPVGPPVHPGPRRSPRPSARTAAR